MDNNAQQKQLPPVDRASLVNCNNSSDSAQCRPLGGATSLIIRLHSMTVLVQSASETFSTLTQRHATITKCKQKPTSAKQTDGNVNNLDRHFINNLLCKNSLGS